MPLPRERQRQPMNRRRFADYFALGCGVVTLLAYYGLRWDALAMAAIVTGAAVLIWSLVWPK